MSITAGGVAQVDTVLGTAFGTNSVRILPSSSEVTLCRRLRQLSQMPAFLLLLFLVWEFEAAYEVPGLVTPTYNQIIRGVSKVCEGPIGVLEMSAKTS